MVKNLRRRLLHSDSDAGVTTYVMIMFGMAFMLYMFQFQSMWTAFSGNASVVNETSQITLSSDPGAYIIANLVNLIISSWEIILVGGAATVGAFVLFYFLGGKEGISSALQFIIPAILLVALNIFVFPLKGVEDSLQFANAINIPVTTALVIFFNLFYILAVVEFIRGTPT